MQENDSLMDEMIVQHAIFKILDSKIIPCFCGANRKIIQKKVPDTLVTRCSKCNAEEPFNIADLAIIGGALINYAVSKNYELNLKVPNVSNEQVFEMIEDLEGLNDWPEEFKRQSLHSKLKILKGGLSTV
jgi:hypothetical protein